MRNSIEKKLVKLLEYIDEVSELLADASLDEVRKLAEKLLGEDDDILRIVPLHEDAAQAVGLYLLYKLLVRRAVSTADKKLQNINARYLYMFLMLLYNTAVIDSGLDALKESFTKIVEVGSPLTCSTTTRDALQRLIGLLVGMRAQVKVLEVLLSEINRTLNLADEK